MTPNRTFLGVAPRLITVGEIVRRLDVPIHRINYIVASRAIHPVALAGRTRLFDEAALARIQNELNELADHRASTRARRLASDS